MEPYSDVGCVLSMDIDCEACKMKVMEVMSSIIGVYNVFIDAKAGLVKVSGEVDPNVLLKAISRTGRHAKLVWAKLDHPKVGGSNYGYGFGAFGNPYSGCGYRTALPECSWRGSLYGYGDYYPMRRFAPDRPFHRRSYFSGSVPRSRYHDEPINLCCHL